MNWDDKSDFEVNKTLSILLGQYKPLEVSNLVVDVIGDVEHHRQYGGPMHATHQDYCDSWGNIGPLIEEHAISLEPLFSGGWCAGIIKTYSFDEAPLEFAHDTCNKNPLRAAAICLIKKLEAEK